jgi:hypothetical protein
MPDCPSITQQGIWFPWWFIVILLLLLIPLAFKLGIRWLSSPPRLLRFLVLVYLLYLPYEAIWTVCEYSVALEAQVEHTNGLEGYSDSSRVTDVRSRPNKWELRLKALTSVGDNWPRLFCVTALIAVLGFLEQLHHNHLTLRHAGYLSKLVQNVLQGVEKEVLSKYEKELDIRLKALGDQTENGHPPA